jgi:hypothetical protein
MLGKRKYLTWLIAVLIASAVLLPSSAQAHNFSVSPAEVSIDNLAPGQEAEFELVIHNYDDITHTFTFAAYHPQQKERRQGRAEFPDDNWISFSPQKPAIPANSNFTAKVKVAVPADSKWVDKDWEVWLGIAPKSSDLLTVKLYVRLLVSTTGGAYSNPWTGLLVRGITIALVVAILSFYYLRRRKRQGREV